MSKQVCKNSGQWFTAARGAVRRCACLMAVMATATLAGCGTTRMSDTSRTATEQLLLSNAIDNAINEIDFHVLAGKDVFLDTQYLKGSVDENYIVSSLRQQMLAHGCRLKPTKDEATYVVEARAGTVGTNRHEVMIGIPQISIPVMPGIPGIPSSIPEIPFAKTTDQRGVAKIAVFAYNQHTGQPVWQSGAFPSTSTAKDTWVFGSGPFQRGSIYERARFAGTRITLPFLGPDEPERRQPEIPVTAEAVFDEQPVMARQPQNEAPSDDANKNASTTPAAPPAAEQKGEAQQVSAEAPVSEPKGKDVVPAGYIIRLPPLEQVQRPDLREAVKGNGVAGEKPPAVKNPQSQNESRGFDLLNLRTWFRS